MKFWKAFFGKKSKDSKSNVVRSTYNQEKSVTMSVGVMKQSENKSDFSNAEFLPENFDEIPYTTNFQELLMQKTEWDILDTNSYAMWFKSKVDNDFIKSLTKQLWIEIYNIQKTHYSFIIADIVNHLKLSTEPIGRMELPVEHSSFPFISENNEKVLLSISKNKGIRFHFSSSSSIIFRLYFIKSFLIYCKEWEKKISQIPQTIELDDGSDFILWWQNICNDNEILQNSNSIGLIQN